MAIQRFHPAKRLSEMVVHNGTIYLAGQVAADMTRDIIGQTEDVLGSIDRLLAEAGSDKSRGAAYDPRADRRSWEAMKAFFAASAADCRV